jgi:hypothetical protein
MRCLYCGKELALLKRWTRGGQFCSEAHKKSYQEEYNRIGLSRLLQAQSKIAPVTAAQAQDRLPENRGPVAQHETEVALEERPREDVHLSAAVDETPLDLTEDSSAEETSQEESSAQENGEDHGSPEDESWEPFQTAGFIKEQLPEPASSEILPHTEPWDRAFGSPLPPDWRTSVEVRQALPEAAQVELTFRPHVSGRQDSAGEVKVAPNEFVHANAVSPAAELLLANRMESAGVVRQIVIPRPADFNAAASLDTALAVAFAAEFRESPVLRLSLSQIAFAEESADVILEDEAADQVQDSAEPVAVALEDSLPVEELDSAVPPVEATPTEAALPATPQENQPEPQPVSESEIASNEASLHFDQQPSQPAAEGETSSSDVPGLANLHDGLNHIEEEVSLSDTGAPVIAQQEPRGLARMVDIPVKTFAPSKPAPKDGANALIEMPVFLPRLTGLPLRPKMGLVPASSAPSSKKQARPAPKNTQPTAEAKVASESTAAPVESKPENGAGGKPAQPSAWRTSTEAAPAAKPAGPPNRTTEGGPKAKSAQPSAAERKRETRPIKPSETSSEESKAAALREVKRSAAPPEAKRPEAAEAKRQDAAEAKRQEPTPAAKRQESVTESSAEPIAVPSFGASQAPSESLLSSLKVKLAIAGALVALCIGIYLIFGGKPQAPAPATPAVDKPGPSIMVGSGGWVEGWAGDPAGAHVGRQITIYRPSLKLSDYRIDFKGEIETKSLGWVFRAADPENYYAMKLAIVTPGLQPKIALLKYIVVHGHETQAGRVPIDLDVKLDTQYTVRVDVRGPKFTTYVQGQLMDTWTDDQLKLGGVGFLNEREERGRIKSVSVSLLSGGK